ncbi:MAG: NAD(P)H-dependent oxidoreductase [Xanthobacteraceae bacterium]|nr:NAD(P)H-dependent oxidoreductase [Xanthobacteraceae bacterium]MCW5677630.1 NAD(P)H-dependent oxidoreductase [Xanthobacteraceae bacterium]
MMKKLLVFAGSIRSGALSARLAAHVARELALMDTETTLISLADYELPIYNGDLEKDEGVPENAKKLKAMMLANDGIYIASPEYNASMPPLLKNAIDWVSRAKEPAGNPYKKCTFALGATSDGRFGGYRGLYHLRQSLELGLGALVIPEQVAIAGASEAFDDRGALKDEGNRKILKAQLEKFVALAGVLP